MRALKIGLSCIAALALGAAALAQPPQLPPGTKPAPNALPPSVKPKVTVVCAVDPAVRVELFKTPRVANSIRMTVRVKNEGGSGVWKSGDNQQTISITLIPGNGAPNRSVGSSRVDLQACKLEYSIVSPK